MFLTVWLRRQEAEIFKMRLLAQGLADIGGKERDMKPTIDAYKALTSAMLPYMAKQQVDKDAQMKEVMAREVGKGVILFQPEMSRSPLLDRARTMTLPDEFRRKLAAKRKQ